MVTWFPRDVGQYTGSCCIGYCYPIGPHLDGTVSPLPLHEITFTNFGYACISGYKNWRTHWHGWHVSHQYVKQRYRYRLSYHPRCCLITPRFYCILKKRLTAGKVPMGTMLWLAYSVSRAPGSLGFRTTWVTYCQPITIQNLSCRYPPVFSNTCK
jgi:hypothetical protein